MKKDDRFIKLNIVNECGLEWILVLLYGHPNVRLRKDAWASIAREVESVNRLMLFLGDFHQVLSEEDKVCWNSGRSIGKEWIAEFVAKFALRDVAWSGVTFTWTNNRKGKNAIFEKLDG